MTPTLDQHRLMVQLAGIDLTNYTFDESFWPRVHEHWYSWVEQGIIVPFSTVESGNRVRVRFFWSIDPNRRLFVTGLCFLSPAAVELTYRAISQWYRQHQASTE